MAGGRAPGGASGHPRRPRRSPAIEGLEVRRLLSAGFVPAPGSPVPVGMSPSGIAVGDFNRDGKIDLAVTNKVDNTVSVLLGNGQGGFAPAPGGPIQVGVDPAVLQVADFNRDGKPDLVVTSDRSNTIDVLLGRGDGTFAPAPGSPLAGGTSVTGIVTGDFNGDGNPDFAVTNVNDQNIGVELGRGDGTFVAAPGSPFPGGTTPFLLATGDFNGDGKADIVATNLGKDSVSLLLGRGDGTFAMAPGSPFAVGMQPIGVVAGDFNGDGANDLAVAARNSNAISILLGDGHGGFRPGATIPVGSKPIGIAAADFDGDGTIDLAVGNNSDNTVSVLLGDGHGGFSPAPGSPYAAGSGPGLLAAASFTAAGAPDIAVGNSSGNAVTVLLNQLFVRGVGQPVTGAVEGVATGNVDVATATSLDPNASAATSSAVIDWGDGTTATPATVTQDAGKVFHVVGNHTFLEEGNYTITAAITIGATTVRATTTAVVADAPLTVTGRAISASTLGAFNGVVATFTDADPNGTVGDYSALIDFGDGHVVPGTIAPNGQGGFDVVGTNAYARAGSFPVAVVVRDVGGSVAGANTTATVTGPLSVVGQSFNAVVGVEFSGVVALFRDADPRITTPADVSATIDFGDGHVAPGTITVNTSGLFQVVGTHTYGQMGTFPVSITVRDVVGNVATAPATATVASALTATGRDIQAVAGKPFTGVVATFRDAIPNLGVGAFSATIDFGDNHTAPGTIEVNPQGGFNVVGTHTYAAQGSFPVRVTIRDQAGSVAMTSSTATVTAVVPPVDRTGPTVIRLARFGFHAHPTRIVLTFSKPLDPVRAEDVANYRLIAPAPDTGPRPGRVVPILSAAYDPSNLTVTLTPAALINVHSITQLEVRSGPGGIADEAGNPLNQSRAGQPGGDTIARFHGLDPATSVVFVSGRGSSTTPAKSHLAAAPSAGAVDALLAAGPVHLRHAAKPRR